MKSMPQTSKILTTKIGFNGISFHREFSLNVDNDHKIDSRHERRETKWANKKHTAKFLQQSFPTEMTATGLVMAE